MLLLFWRLVLTSMSFFLPLTFRLNRLIGMLGTLAKVFMTGRRLKV